jgi:hypothetical protein
MNIGQQKVDYLILNRGAHYSDTMITELTKTLQLLIDRYPKVRILWRSTPSGHISCEDTLQKPPLTKPQDMAVANPQFHWSTFATTNIEVRKLVVKQFPQV